MNLNLRFVRRAVPFCAAVLVSSCGVVGKGLVPNKLLITTGGLTQPNAIRAYTCVSGALHGIVTFTDGEAADFTGRAPLKWSSSDPSVIAVDPNTGALSPAQAGSATITASYYTLTASVPIKVSTLSSSDLKLYKLDQEKYTAIDPTAGFTISTNTDQPVMADGKTPNPNYFNPAIQQISLVATESASSGATTVMRNITSAATFSITDAAGNTFKTDVNGNSSLTDSSGKPLANTSYFVLGVNGFTSTFTGFQLSGDPVGAHSPYTVTAALTACPSPISVSTTLNVAPVHHLVLEPEADPTGAVDLGFGTVTTDSSGNIVSTVKPLVKGYGAERLKLLAFFGPGDTGPSEDMSLFGQYTSSNTAVAAFNFIYAQSVNILSALLTDPAQIDPSTKLSPATNVQATFTDGTNSVHSSNTLAIAAIDAGDLTGTLDVEPQTGGTATATSNFDSVQYHAIGTFMDGTKQDVSRVTTFTAADPTLVTIDSYPSVAAFSGLAFAGSPASTTTDQMTTINAAAEVPNSGGTTITGSAPFTLKAQPDAPTP